MDKMEKIGFVGLGAMGKPMAVNIVKAGMQVFCFDVNTENLNELKSQGATACVSGAEVAEMADIIFTSLPNAAIVEAVMSGNDGLLKHCKKDSVIVDMSSVSPSSTLKMAKVAETKGIYYVDAPVSGGTKGAVAGTLTIMVGAEETVFNRIKPVLEIIGKDIYHVGETGSGDAIKIVNNLMLGCNMATLAEALILGVKCGVNLETMQEIISKSSGRSYVMDAKLENFIIKNNYEGGFALDLQYKDLGLALEAGRENAVPLPMTALATQIFESGRAAGLGRQDMSSIIKVWEKLTNVQVNGAEDESI